MGAGSFVHLCACTSCARYVWSVNAARARCAFVTWTPMTSAVILGLAAGAWPANAEVGAMAKAAMTAPMMAMRFMVGSLLVRSVMAGA